MNESLYVISQLVSDFKDQESYYTGPKYQEQEVRKDFIDKFFTALGWDVNHEKQKNPYKQEVKVERKPDSRTQRRAELSYCDKSHVPYMGNESDRLVYESHVWSEEAVVLLNKETEMKKKDYPVVISPSGEGCFVADITALPGCLAQGDTMFECLEELNAVKALWIETAKKHKQKLPNVESEYRKVRSLSAAQSES